MFKEILEVCEAMPCVKPCPLTLLIIGDVIGTVTPAKVLSRDKMERDYCKLFCGAPLTFQGYGKEQRRSEATVSILACRFDILILANGIVTNCPNLDKYG